MTVPMNEKVEDITPRKNMTVNNVVEEMMHSGGFTAKKLAVGVTILEKMFKDKECKKFLSFPACIIATGTRGVIRELVKRKMIDIIITTCGSLDHDLARVWRDYYHGSFFMDDTTLHQQGINRLGNILIPNESYGIVLEKKIQPILKELYLEKKRFSTKEITWALGNKTRDKDSILYWASKNKIPVYIPGIMDGAVGYQIWSFKQEHRDFEIDEFMDEKELADTVYNAERSGALMIGGGISKHHTMWWNQFRGGLDYVVYITTAVEFDGSLSGARIREAISWGKVQEEARYVTIEGEATLVLPFLIASVLDRL